MHLRLPGGGPTGPTLEIFQYDPSLEHAPAAREPPRLWSHRVRGAGCAFGPVIDPGEGGETVGEVVTTATADGRRVTWGYVTDPEGNIVELQSWSAG